MQWQGYLRRDGRKGIRNYVAVVYLGTGAQHVAREIVGRLTELPVQLLGFSESHDLVYTPKLINEICTHPNIGGVLLVSEDCDHFRCLGLEQYISQSGRPVHILDIQKEGGTRKSIAVGVHWADWCINTIADTLVVSMSTQDLIVGAISYCDDVTCGMSANPAVGRAMNKVIEGRGTVLYAGIGEMAGLNDLIADRAIDPEIAEQVNNLLKNVSKKMVVPDVKLRLSNGFMYSTLEEKSFSAFNIAGNAPISGLIMPAERPGHSGLYLIDLLSGAGVKEASTYSKVSMQVASMIACGCHLIVITTGKGSVVGSAITPVIKVCANPDIYAQLKEDTDINTGDIISGDVTLEVAGTRIYEGITIVSAGIRTCSEDMRHQEFSC